jgi:ENTS family enterobactin (siderophore) exporter
MLLALTSGGLAVNATVAHCSLVAIYLVSALAAGLGGVVSTTVLSVVPSLITGNRLVAAFASMQIVDQVGMVAGPALSGVLIAAAGRHWRCVSTAQVRGISCTGRSAGLGQG